MRQPHVDERPVETGSLLMESNESDRPTCDVVGASNMLGLQLSVEQTEYVVKLCRAALHEIKMPTGCERPISAPLLCILLPLCISHTL